MVLPDVVVEKVEKGSAAEQAGIKKGDVILSWSRGDEGGKLDTPFVKSYVSLQQLYFGNVVMRGLHGGDGKKWQLGENETLGVRTRPNFTSHLLRVYLTCEELKLRHLSKAIKCYDAAAEGGIGELDFAPFVWLRLLAADLAGEGTDWRNGALLYEKILRDREHLNPLIANFVLLRQSSLFSQHQEFSKATKSLRAALDESRSIKEGDLLSIEALRGLVRASYLENDLSQAELCAKEALGQSERLSPNDSAIAISAYYAGTVSRTKTDLATAEKYFRLSFELGEKRHPHWAGLALTELGGIAWRQGNLSKASEYLEKAIKMLSENSSDSDQLAIAYDRLSNVVRDRGNLVLAEAYLLKALALLPRNGAGERAGGILNDLAFIALYRGDPFDAEQRFRAALDVQSQYEPGSTDFGNTLMGLGMALATQGKFVDAERNLAEALQIQMKLAPKSTDIPRIKNILGDIGKSRGDLQGAAVLYREALATFGQLSPESTFTVQSLSGLAKVSALSGSLTEAENLNLQALAMIDKLAPESAQAAEILESLAEVKRDQGQMEAAVGYYERALRALESQTTTLGGTPDVVAGFRARHLEFYRGYSEMLVKSGQTEAAFDVMERSRARTLLETLAKAEVNVSKGADPALLAKEKSLKADLRGKSERRIHLLGEKHTDEELKEIEKQISDLTFEYQEVESQIRASSPSYAALTQPQPLTAKQIQTELLDKDTLLLEYSLGEERSHVFVVAPDSLEAFELPKRADIEKQARLVYQLLTDRNRPIKGETEAHREKRWAESAKAYDTAAAELSRMVLAPVAAQMKNKRLVIVADGALHYVPFAALPEPSATNSPATEAAQPLTVNHEIVSLPSASVLALLRQQYKDRKPAPNAVAVLADPVFARNDPRVSGHLSEITANAGTRGPAKTDIGKTLEGSQPQPAKAAATAKTERSALKKAPAKPNDLDALLVTPTSASLLTRSAGDLGLDRNGQLALPRLRYTREEADAIYAVSPRAKAFEATDFRATRATAISPELASYRIIHFATHGLLNSQHPELSGLVFSLVDKNGKSQDGFLTLQDIYNLNLPADLVVLSACETGLGKEISGEGLIGLTRGFMYAGASRVVASLWNVSDVATARLMAEFYRAMEKDGLPPAAALRAAQIKMLSQKRWSSPYYWAAFQLQGEWK
jgi:CHAT domain-containing protein/Tfp pilus assembly protein PilF